MSKVYDVLNAIEKVDDLERRKKPEFIEWKRMIERFIAEENEREEKRKEEEQRRRREKEIEEQKKKEAEAEQTKTEHKKMAVKEICCPRCGRIVSVE